MKRLLSLALLGMFTFGMLGCHASGDVDTDHDASSTTYKKTTTVDHPSGTYEKKTTEVKQY
jgi:hypothetical protein